MRVVSDLFSVTFKQALNSLISQRVSLAVVEAIVSSDLPSLPMKSSRYDV